MKLTSVFILLLIVSLIPVSCATLPAIVKETSPPLTDQVLERELNQLFPPGYFQFVHSLELTLPGNHSAMLMGVVNVRSLDHTIHCVAMTLEGLVLLEAEYTGDVLTVKRGIPPFDDQKLTLGLIRDIQLIFFRPDGKLVEAGLLSNQQKIFRFSNKSGIKDVIISPDRSAWRLNAYDNTKRIIRAVQYKFKKQRPKDETLYFPSTIILTARHPSRYTLTMTLLGASLLPDSNIDDSNLNDSNLGGLLTKPPKISRLSCSNNTN